MHISGIKTSITKFESHNSLLKQSAFAPLALATASSFICVNSLMRAGQHFYWEHVLD